MSSVVNQLKFHTTYGLTHRLSDLNELENSHDTLTICICNWIEQISESLTYSSAAVKAGFISSIYLFEVILMQEKKQFIDQVNLLLASVQIFASRNHTKLFVSC